MKVPRERVERLLEIEHRSRELIEWAVMFKQAQLVVFYGSLLLLIFGQTKAGLIGLGYQTILWLIAHAIYGVAMKRLADEVRGLLDE